MTEIYDNNSFAFLTTLSTVKPKNFIKSGAGADSPNVVIPTTLPSSVTYLCHPNGDPASTATRLRILRGRTFSLYAASCFSNNSHDGILTTRDAIPCSFNFACASITRETSDPVAIKMTAGFSASDKMYAPFSSSVAGVYFD